MSHPDAIKRRVGVAIALAALVLVGLLVLWDKMKSRGLEPTVEDLAKPMQTLLVMSWFEEQGERVIPQLIAGTDHPDADVRRNCFITLGNMRAVAAVPAIVKHAETDVPHARVGALIALGLLSPHTRPHVEVATKQALDASLPRIVRIEALLASDRILKGDPARVELLRTSIRDGDVSFRIAALRCIEDDPTGLTAMLPAVLESRATAPNGTAELHDRVLEALAPSPRRSTPPPR